MLSIKRIVVLLCVSISAQVCFAADDMLMENDSRQGHIDAVDLNVRQIVVDDWVYHLALDLKVHGDQGLETDFALRQGRQIRYELNPATLGQNVTTIVDVWLLQD